MGGEQVQMEQLQGLLVMLKEFWAVLVMVRKQDTTLVKKMHMEQMQQLLPLHRWHAALARHRKQQTISCLEKCWFEQGVPCHTFFNFFMSCQYQILHKPKSKLPAQSK